MSALFVDTAGWAAAADAADALCAKVCSSRDNWLKAGGFLVTTDYICDETLSLLKMRLGIKAAEKWWNQLEASSRLHMELVDANRAEKARGIFFRHTDKGYSFTDCTSFVVMKEMGIRKALTLDRHFRQAGFEVLPSR